MTRGHDRGEQPPEHGIRESDDLKRAQLGAEMLMSVTDEWESFPSRIQRLSQELEYLEGPAAGDSQSTPEDVADALASVREDLARIRARRARLATQLTGIFTHGRDVRPIFVEQAGILGLSAERVPETVTLELARRVRARAQLEIPGARWSTTQQDYSIVRCVDDVYAWLRSRKSEPRDQQVQLLTEAAASIASAIEALSMTRSDGEPDAPEFTPDPLEGEQRWAKYRDELSQHHKDRVLVWEKRLGVLAYSDRARSAAALDHRSRSGLKLMAYAIVQDALHEPLGIPAVGSALETRYRVAVARLARSRAQRRSG